MGTFRGEPISERALRRSRCAPRCGACEVRERGGGRLVSRRAVPVRVEPRSAANGEAIAIAAAANDSGGGRSTNDSATRPRHPQRIDDERGAELDRRHRVGIGAARDHARDEVRDRVEREAGDRERREHRAGRASATRRLVEPPRERSRAAHRVSPYVRELGVVRVDLRLDGSTTSGVEPAQRLAGGLDLAADRVPAGERRVAGSRSRASRRPARSGGAPRASRPRRGARAGRRPSAR